MKWDEIVRPCDRYSNETVTLRKHVTKYKNTRKWIVKFFRKFKNSGIEIAWVNSILITKSINLQLFTLILLSVWGSVVMLTYLNWPQVLSLLREKTMLGGICFRLSHNICNFVHSKVIFKRISSSLVKTSYKIIKLNNASFA